MWMHLCSRAFIAGTNQSISKVEERLDGTECFSEDLKEDVNKNNARFVEINGCSPQFAFHKMLNRQMLTKTYHLRAVYRPRLRKIYLYGYPLFYNCVSTSIQYKQYRRSDNNDHMLHQALSTDDVNQLTNLHESTHLFYINKNAQENYVRTPCIATNQLSVQPENWVASDLLEASELEVFTLSENSLLQLDSVYNLNVTGINYACGLSFDHTDCRSCLCLRRKNAIKSSVSKAKRFIDEAVQSLCALPSPVYASHSRKRKTKVYFINLAHLLLVIACLRGVL
ncbi:uncharacterized protein Dvir_GJ25842 [Drosophila virilis]|uniref:Uncharacterized protein n=1 Tax=Drosophila virilis TaxID=7244 RepID=A0A0Q9W7Y4_DROVI|nr:uncharacterized protein LOC26530612 [Drosophila virilis]KRF80908.1 uncharacterized protein Dvir_GJ25842 [Drosophila virilis]